MCPAQVSVLNAFVDVPRFLARHKWAVPATLIVLVAIAVSAWRLSATGSKVARSKNHTVTAKVEKRQLATTLQLPATYRLADPTQVVAPAANEGSDATYLTGAIPGQGSKVNPGQVIVEVNYRPIILIPARLPLYRPIKPGDTGGDVANLQAGLRALGYQIPDSETGTFGSASQQAVAELYDKVGFTPTYTQGTKPATDAVITKARQAVESARNIANAAISQGG